MKTANILSIALSFVMAALLLFGMQALLLASALSGHLALIDTAAKLEGPHRFSG